MPNVEYCQGWQPWVLQEVLLHSLAIENVLREERDAIALPHWHFIHRTLNTERPAGKTEFCKNLT